MLIHEPGSHVELRYDGRILFRYVYDPTVLPNESPKPYFHPLKTLAGNELTLVRPHDHPWHVGLAMTSPNLSGQNFWGGPTYVRDAGYVERDDHGRIRHRDWRELHHEDDQARLIEHLEWIARDGVTWIDEERRIIVDEIDLRGGYWSMAMRFHLRNVAHRPLVFSSPTAEGRPMAGYGGLFWRGPRSFGHGTIQAAGGLEGPATMGQAAPWLAFTGRHDGNGEQSTLVFIDRPTNPRFPNQWFVRNDPYAGVSCSFMFDEPYVLPANEALTLDYRIIPANGVWSSEMIEDTMARAR
ncbi:MAG: PmoA family protein [Chloroflexota bacterium]